jgi:hypothetical protein
MAMIGSQYSTRIWVLPLNLAKETQEGDLPDSGGDLRPLGGSKLSKMFRNIRKIAQSG